MSTVASAAATSSKSSPAATWPQWREHLYKIPKDDLCGSQKDLIRSMELVDTITSMFDENKKGPVSTVDDPDAPFMVFLPVLEVLHLPIKDTSVFSLISVELTLKLAKFLWAAANQMNCLAKGVTTPENVLIEPSKSPVAWAIYSLVSAAPLQFGQYNTFTPGTENHTIATKGCAFARHQLTLESNITDNEKEMKRLQETYNTQLTLNDLIEVSEGMYTTLVLKAAEFRARLSSEGSIENDPILVNRAADALESFLSTTEDSEEVSWYRSSMLYEVLGTTTQLTTFREVESISLRIEKIFQRNLKAATMVDDPLRQAWAIFDFALASVSSNGFYYSELKTLVDMGHDNMAICKPWVPPYFRKKIIQGSDMVESMLNAAKKMYPTDYKTRKLGMEVMMGLDPSEVSHFDLSDPHPRQRCSACDQESRTMSACGRCRKVYYCNAVCQKKHWKAGHKKTCGK